MEREAVFWDCSCVDALKRTVLHKTVPLQVKQLKSAEYKNIACVENRYVQSFSFTTR